MPKNLVSRDGSSSLVSRQPAHLHAQAESGAYLRDSSRVPRRRPIMKPPYAIGSVPSLSGHANAYRWRSLPRVRRHRASKPQGSSERIYMIYVCMVGTFSRVWINRLWLPILSSTAKNKFSLSLSAPENLLSREGVGRPAPRVSLLNLRTRAESGAYSQNSSRFTRRHPFIYTAIAMVSPEFIGSHDVVSMAFTAESPPAQGQ